MTILTAGACGFIVTTSGATIPAAVGTAAGVLVTGVKLWVHSEPVKVALATAVGTGISSGAISGAIAHKVVSGAASGALIGGMSSAGVGSVLAGSYAAAGGALATNPIGLLTVGTSYDGNEVRYDCWKPVVRDTSEELTNGKTLGELMSHPNVGKVTITPGEWLSKVVIENIWEEKFEIEYVILKDCDELLCHANRLSE